MLYIFDDGHRSLACLYFLWITLSPPSLPTHTPSINAMLLINVLLYPRSLSLSLSFFHISPISNFKGVLSNPQSLGLAPNAPVHIIVAGDSAGGNLAAAMTVRAIRDKIPPPTGLLLIYPALFLGELASISRLLFINDPILTFATCNMCNTSYLPADIRPAAYVCSFDLSYSCLFLFLFIYFSITVQSGDFPWGCSSWNLGWMAPHTLSRWRHWSDHRWLASFCHKTS